MWIDLDDDPRGRQGCSVGCGKLWFSGMIALLLHRYDPPAGSRSRSAEYWEGNRPADLVGLAQAGTG
jgi:hypothetical protein